MNGPHSKGKYVVEVLSLAEELKTMLWPVNLSTEPHLAITHRHTSVILPGCHQRVQWDQELNQIAFRSYPMSCGMGCNFI